MSKKSTLKKKTKWGNLQVIAPDPCDCGRSTFRKVCETISGYFYIGSICTRCGVWSRDSYYYLTKKHALKMFVRNTWRPTGRYIWEKRRQRNQMQK